MIELVGPGGTGKTTLSTNMRDRHGVQVLKVPPTKHLPPLVLGLVAATRLALTYRLQPSGWARLARNCAAVEQAMRYSAGRAGVWVIDEGPVRCLRELRCGPGRELDAWTSYAGTVVERLGKRAASLLVVRMDIERAVREKRYHARTRHEFAERRAEPGFRNRLGLFLDQRLGWREAPAFLGERLDAMLLELDRVSIERFTCHADESPEEIAARFEREIVAPRRPGRQGERAVRVGEGDLAPRLAGPA